MIFALIRCELSALVLITIHLIYQHLATFFLRKDFRLVNNDSPCTCGVPLPPPVVSIKNMFFNTKAKTFLVLVVLILIQKCQ